MTRYWPVARKLEEAFEPLEEDVDVKMPSVEEQDRLVDLHFKYVHPDFPVLHEKTFRQEYAVS